MLRRRSLGALSRLDGAVRGSISLTGPNTIAPPPPPPPEPYVAPAEYAVRNDWTREEVGETRSPHGRAMVPLPEC